MKRIEQETEIKVEYQILISKKGTRMLPDENISEIQEEQRFQSTLTMQERDQLSQYFTVFVYNKKMLQKNSSKTTNEIDSNSLEKFFDKITEEDE